MKAYSVPQLRKLAKIRAKGLSDYYDDEYTSDKDSFGHETELFFKWIEKMEKKNRIDYLLTLNTA